MLSEAYLMKLHQEQPDRCLLATAHDLLCESYGSDYLGSVSIPPLKNRYSIGSSQEQLSYAYELLTMCSLSTGESTQRSRCVASVVRILAAESQAKPLVIPGGISCQINQRLVVFVAADLINIFLKTKE